MNLVIMIKTIFVNDVTIFDTDDILSLNSIINIYSITIIIKYVFKDSNKFYPQIYLTDCRYNEI